MSGKSKKTQILRSARIILAASVFVMFALLFFNWGGVFSKSFGFIAKLQFWPAVLAANVGIMVLIIALTMVFGRVYCSVLCPWGILQDGIYRIVNLGPARRRFRMRFSRARNWIRYGILALYLILIAFSLGSVAYLLEPYSNFGALSSSIAGKSALPVVAVAAVTFVILCIFVWKGGRLWCNTVCPVGTILGLLGKRSFFRPVINDSKCISCGVCAKGCRASCIDVKNHSVDMSRCVMCLDCLSNCKEGAIDYGWSLSGRDNVSDTVKEEKTAACVEQDSGTDGKMSRRQFLATSSLAVGALATATACKGPLKLPGGKTQEGNALLVPAGAGSAKSFYSLCVACQLCIGSCPEKILRPIVAFDNFMKPSMSYDSGYCDPECTVCGNLCPTGAITAVTAEQKRKISIGHAVCGKSECYRCEQCVRSCPVGALELADTFDPEEDAILVDTDLCIGCGICQNVCPVQPEPYLHVEAYGTHVLHDKGE